MSVIERRRARCMARGLCGCLVVVLLVFAPTPARAQTAQDRAAAQALFDAARAEMKAGATPEVCAKFEESQRIDPQIGTQYNLADCLEQIGRLASAWINFHELHALTRAREQPERAQVVKARAAALEPRLTKVRIVLSGEAPPGLVVRRAKQKISARSIGAALPLDPGRYVFLAEAPGFKAWRKEVDVAGEGAEVVVTIPALEPRPPKPEVEAPPTLSLAAIPPLAPPPMKVEPAEAAGLHHRAIAGLTVGSVGLVAAAVGGGFGIDAMSKRSKAEPMCDEVKQACTAEGQVLMNDAIDSARVSTTLFIAGGVLAAGGAALWLTAPSGDAAVSANLIFNPSGIGVVGRF